MKIHTLVFSPKNWMELAQELSQLDRFDAQWQAIERREQKTLKELKSIATVRSVRRLHAESEGIAPIRLKKRLKYC